MRSQSIPINLNHYRNLRSHFRQARRNHQMNHQKLQMKLKIMRVTRTQNLSQAILQTKNLGNTYSSEKGTRTIAKRIKQRKPRIDQKKMRKNLLQSRYRPFHQLVNSTWNLTAWSILSRSFRIWASPTFSKAISKQQLITQELKASSYHLKNMSWTKQKEED